MCLCMISCVATVAIACTLCIVSRLCPWSQQVGKGCVLTICVSDVCGVVAMCCFKAVSAVSSDCKWTNGGFVHVLGDL